MDFHKTVYEDGSPGYTKIPLKASDSVVTKTYDDVSLYFSDIVGFTAIGKKSTPTQIMKMMDELFKLFDSIITKSGLKNQNSFSYWLIWRHLAVF